MPGMLTSEIDQRQRLPGSVRFEQHPQGLVGVRRQTGSHAPIRQHFAQNPAIRGVVVDHQDAGFADHQPAAGRWRSRPGYRRRRAARVK